MFYYMLIFTLLPYLTFLMFSPCLNEFQHITNAEMCGMKQLVLEYEVAHFYLKESCSDQEIMSLYNYY